MHSAVISGTWGPNSGQERGPVRPQVLREIDPGLRRRQRHAFRVGLAPKVILHAEISRRVPARPGLFCRGIRRLRKYSKRAWTAARAPNPTRLPTGRAEFVRSIGTEGRRLEPPSSPRWRVLSGSRLQSMPPPIRSAEATRPAKGLYVQPSCAISHRCRWLIEIPPIAGLPDTLISDLILRRGGS